MGRHGERSVHQVHPGNQVVKTGKMRMLFAQRYSTARVGINCNVSDRVASSAEPPHKLYSQACKRNLSGTSVREIQDIDHKPVLRIVHFDAYYNFSNLSFLIMTMYMQTTIANSLPSAPSSLAAHTASNTATGRAKCVLCISAATVAKSLDSLINGKQEYHTMFQRSQVSHTAHCPDVDLDRCILHPDKYLQPSSGS